MVPELNVISTDITFTIGFLFFVSIISFLFWIWMLIDCLKRDFKKENDRIIWLLVIILAHLVGSIIYYFIVMNKIKN
jgi:hypothetical protein